MPGPLAGGTGQKAILECIDYTKARLRARSIPRKQFDVTLLCFVKHADVASNVAHDSNGIARSDVVSAAVNALENRF